LRQRGNTSEHGALRTCGVVQELRYLNELSWWVSRRQQKVMLRL
jgi:hypothetical protein